jgi:UTP--glucose-1-phosphate uridylyltransferase
MFPLVDRDGLTKPVIQIIAEEALESGIEDICIVTAPGDEEQYRRHFQAMEEELLPSFKNKEWALRESERLARLEPVLTYAVQETPEGYGHAVYCAREFVGDEPFLLLLGDHVYVSHQKKRCAEQLLEVYHEYRCNLSAVKRTPEDLLHLYGTVAGPRIATAPPVYRLSEIKEKPSLDYADEHLRTEGLRRGYYLCFFGMHVFTPALFACLEEHLRDNVRERGEIQLTSALEKLRQRERYLAFEAEGERYDTGVPFGFVETQIALALHSPMREEMLGSLVQIIARSGQGQRWSREAERG